MKKVILAVIGLTISAAAYAACVTNTTYVDGRTIICTTCCYAGNCSTTCY